jgi:CRP/FNR family transcriptional regulator
MPAVQTVFFSFGFSWNKGLGLGEMENLVQRFAGLFEPALITEMIQSGQEMQFKEGDVIIDYDRLIKGMPLVLDGTVRVMKRDEDNREILLYYVSSQESCTMAYTCCMELRKSEIRAVAETDVTLLSIPPEKLDEWLLRYPSWKTYVFQSFNQRFNELLKSVENIAFRKLDERSVDYLLQKSEVIGKRVLGVSHQQIAEELGTSRVVISRLLKHLENEGKVLLYRNELKIMPGLKEG